MYSVVLMVAMTSGGEVIDFGRRGGCYGCHGCRGVVVSSCYGCGGCYGGCRGVVSSSCYGCSGCYGGCSSVVYSSCHGCHGCSGVIHHSCHGCHGCSGVVYQSCHGCHGCSGVVYHSCHGCHGCHGKIVYHSCGGCCGGVIVKPKDGDKKDKGGKDGKGGKDKEEEISEAPAKLVVKLPADATLKIEGLTTKSTGEERTFVTPKLPTSERYSWTLQAEVVKDGKPVTWTQKVAMTPGQTARVTLTPPTGVVSR